MKISAPFCFPLQKYSLGFERSISSWTPRRLIFLHVWLAGAGEGLTRKESLTKNISSEFFWTSRHHKCRWATEMFGSSGLDENFDSRICLKWPFYRKNHWRQFKFISDTRNHEINSAFRNVKASIPESIHHDPEKLMCLFTNASDNHWVILLTQVPKAFLSCSMLAQDHQPIAVLSWSFNGSERRLSVIAKETFSIIEASEKLRHFLLTTQNLRVFTLWYIKTSFTLCFPMHDREHFGRLKYLGRFLSRWWHPTKAGRLGAMTVPKGLANPLLQKDFFWPFLIEIRQPQDLAITSPLSLHFDPERKIWENHENLVWIPDNNELRLRICNVGHSRAAGHRGVETTLSSIKSFCWWPDMEGNVQSFCFSCLQCHFNDNCGSPRPLLEIIYGMTCNEVLRFDFISMHPLNSKPTIQLLMTWSLRTTCLGLLNCLLPVHSIILFLADALIDLYKREVFHKIWLETKKAILKTKHWKTSYRRIIILSRLILYGQTLRWKLNAGTYNLQWDLCFQNLLIIDLVTTDSVVTTMSEHFNSPKRKVPEYK